MSISRHHTDWLSLVPNSGPFLSLPVLAQAFPQGLDAHDAENARRLRMAFVEWDGNQPSLRPDSGIHRAWIKLVLGETLGYDELLAEGQAIPQSLRSEIAEYGETLRPDWIVNDPTTTKARLLIQVYPRSQSLTRPVALSRWKASPDTRMMQLLHDTGIRLDVYFVNRAPDLVALDKPGDLCDPLFILLKIVTRPQHHGFWLCLDRSRRASTCPITSGLDSKPWCGPVPHLKPLSFAVA